MCGFAGLLDPRRGENALEESARKMSRTLRHRGPDSEGTWVDAPAGFAVGHQRLAILDLSPAGHQPMVSSCGRWLIAYNGEVYNAGEIRDELRTKGRQFRGHSDTEAILEACAEWGPRNAVERMIGMFAFSLWDRESRTLWLVRDRLGIKPLYWGQAGSLFLFGSELKAFHACEGWQGELDLGAIALLMRHNYIPAPHAIYRDVRKLEPGSLLELRRGSEPRIERYWNPLAIAVSSREHRFDGSDREAVDHLESLLRDSVGRRMIADVPLGAFLSGGIDSSVVVALMQAQSDRPVRTFTIGFREKLYDEAPHAAAVARHLGTDHTELYVEPSHALEIIPRLPEWWDEPFADSSQVPTFLVSELTRKHVTVALSGDGGDELFAGYDRYFWANTLWQRIHRRPRGLRRTAAGAIRGLSPDSWNRLSTLLPSRVRPRRIGDKLYKLAAALTLDQPDAIYRELVTHWGDPESLVPGAVEPKGPLWDPEIARLLPDFTERMQVLDLLTYLPGDLLTKMDRASMAVSLEARVPLLDHRVVEFALRMPMRLRARGQQGKWLLRQVLDRHVPRHMVERPKMGFGVPIEEWLRGPLRDWAESLIDERRLRNEGIFNPTPIREKWAEHLSGRQNWHYLLWNVLVFQAWKETWQRSRAAAA